MGQAAIAHKNKPLKKLVKHCGLTGKLVLIEWVDSHHRAGWTTDEPADEPLTCLSVGWLIHDGTKAKTLAAHITAEEARQRNGEMTIPCLAIKRVEVLM